MPRSPGLARRRAAISRPWPPPTSTTRPTPEKSQAAATAAAVLAESTVMLALNTAPNLGSAA